MRHGSVGYGNKLILLLIGLLGGCCMSASTVWALSTDQDQLIQLSADQVDVDNNQGISTYRGHVQLEQGSIRLQADQMQVYHAKKAEKIIVTGKPVKFQQRTDQQETVKGEALRVEYYAESEKIILLGDAKLWLEQKQFSGQRLEYDIRQNLIKGGAQAGQENSRIHITLPPLNNPKNTNNKPSQLNKTP